MPVPTITHLRPSQYRSIPWRNGRGQSTVIAVGPESAGPEVGDFQWRVSVADIATAEPFSSFPGYERIIMVIDGTGILLDHGKEGGQARLDKLMPHWFQGDWPTQCWPIEGPVRDFNVLTRYDAASGTLSTLHLNAEPVRIPLREMTSLIYCLKGTIRLKINGEGEERELKEQETLRIDHSGSGENEHGVIVSSAGDEAVGLLVGISEH